jgi:alpha-glucosidase
MMRVPGLLLSITLALGGCDDDTSGGGLDAARDAGTDSPMTDARDRDLSGDQASDGGASGVFELEVTSRKLRLTLLGDDLVRVHYIQPGGKAHPERGWTTVIETWPTGKLAFTDSGSYWSRKTARLEIRVDKQDAAVSFHDLSGAAISEDVADQTGGAYVRRVRKKLPADEHFYGLGEKTGPLDKRGQKLEMWTTDPLYPKTNYTSTADPIYQSHPVVLGLRGGKAYGIYLASTFRTHFDLGYTVGDELRLETEGGDLDYFFFYGPAVSRVVELYTSITGRTPLPPLWSLGYHQCRWSYYPESVVRQITSEFRKRKIPCDGFWLDIDYMDGFRSFTWDSTRFPDPKKLLSDLAQQGFKVTTIIDPGIKHDPNAGYKVHDDGVAGGHFVTLPDKSLFIGKVWPGDAVFPDFTRPATRAWWAGLVKSFVGSGLRGIWIDMNEPVTWDPAGFPLDSVWDGEGTVTDHRETRNVFALLMARATREGLEQAMPDGRPFVLTRSGFAGVQRYSTVWTGDMQTSWDHLKMAPAMLMNLGLSGVAFAGTDVGGFSGSPSPELYARWIQLGTVSTFFRTHVQEKTPPQEPWSFGSEVEAISKQHIELRYRLLPYVYSLMWDSSQTGAPALRPLLYEFQDDPETYGRSHELLLGPHLLAAPVVNAGRTARALYLPAGPWFDYWTEAVFSGKQTASVDAPLSRLPLLVRAGAIIPSTEPVQYVGEKQPTALYLDLYPVNGAKPRSFTLYRDDGETRAHEKGAYHKLALRLEATAGGATLDVDAPAGSYAPPEQHLRLRFHGVAKQPSRLEAGGKALAKLSSLAELDGKDGWTYEPARRVAHARLPYPKQATKVVCSYDGAAKLAVPVQVTISATLPAGTPSGSIYLASNLFGWEPDGKLLTRSGQTASVTLALEAGMTLAYKYTRGSWTTVEKGGACAESDNRKLTVVDQGGGVMTVSDSVAGWADLCTP